MKLSAGIARSPNEVKRKCGYVFSYSEVLMQSFVQIKLSASVVVCSDKAKCNS